MSSEVQILIAHDKVLPVVLIEQILQKKTTSM